MMTLKGILREEIEIFTERVTRVVAENIGSLLIAGQGVQEVAPVEPTPPPKQARKPRKFQYVSKLNYWKADKNAKRVPTFVQEQTGLDTKLAIIAKYGAGAEFKRKDTQQPKITPRPPIVRQASKDDVLRALGEGV